MSRHMRQIRQACVSLALVAVPFVAYGQAVKGADTLSPRAAAESLAVLRELAGRVRAAPNDAELRYRQGMVAWALSIRAKAKPPVSGLAWPALAGLADSSLRLARHLQPSSARYELALGGFLRASSDPILRIGATSHFEAAAELARSGPDSALRPATLLELGRLQWLFYDSYVHQVVPGQCPDLPLSIAAASGKPANPADEPAATILPTPIALKVLHNALVDCMFPMRQGGLDAESNGAYRRAEGYFRDAYAAMPNDDRSFRQVAMVLAEKNRWSELAAFARDRVARRPGDGWAWLCLGLALERNGVSSRAVAVFDTALKALPERERARLFSFERLLNERDSLAFHNASASDRTDRERSFWTMADPLWSREGNDPRTEFLARVTFAELRWTVDELGVRGADSDRGHVYIRYGPPDAIGAARGCNPCLDVGQRDSLRERTASMRGGGADVVTFWDYDNGLTVVFWGQATYGTARIPVLDVSHFEHLLELRPAAFDNLAAEKLLPISVRIMRFRAPADSVDLLTLFQAPVAAIRDSAANVRVRSDVWLFGRNNAGDVRDSLTLPESGIERAVYRVAPSRYLYRVEATAPGTMTAGRTMEWITAERDSATGFALRGFALSDLLLATAIRPAKSVPIRWSDFSIAPVLAPVTKGSTVDIIWENYELSARGGQTQYSVSITLQRQRTASGRIAAAILGFAANAVGIDRRDDRVTFSFERAGPAAGVAFVDHVALALRDTPSGEYRLTLEVTDESTGRTARSIATLAIRE